MNIANESVLHECTSCQLCAAVCPVHAISISLNFNGFYRPQVDEAKCINCNLCISVCYKFDESIPKTDVLDDKIIYGVKTIDQTVIEETTSGGVADVLARHLINLGYKCIGVCYDTDRAIAYHKVVSTEKETIGFRGSKYIQSYTFPAFQELVVNCKTEKFAVFGLPCQTYAIHRFLEKRHCREKHILIDMYCHGTPSLLIWRKYNNEIKRLVGLSHFDEINFRSKIKGWGKFYVVAIANDVKVFISNRKKNEFYSLFFSDIALNDSCYACKLRSTLEYTDIRLGDFWGKEYVNDRQGISAVSVITDKGKILFQEIEDKIIWKEHFYRDFLPYQSYGKTYPKDDKLRDIVFNQLRDENISLKESIRTIYSAQSVKQRIKRCLKSVIDRMPDGIISLVRMIYYKFNRC